MEKLSLILVAGAALLSFGCQTENGSHSHTFSNKWSSNPVGHWHASTCGHSEEVSERDEHKGGDFLSGGENGHYKICKVCNAKYGLDAEKFEIPLFYNERCYSAFKNRANLRKSKKSGLLHSHSEKTK